MDKISLTSFTRCLIHFHTKGLFVGKFPPFPRNGRTLIAPFFSDPRRSCHLADKKGINFRISPNFK